MTKETIERLDHLRGKLADVDRQLLWMDKWKRSLDESDDTWFQLTVATRSGKCVLQTEEGRGPVEQMFERQLFCLTKKKERLEREIESL